MTTYPLQPLPDPTSEDEDQTVTTKPAKVFFSYAHEDEAFKDKLIKHLSILQRQSIIEAWHDRMIAPGAAWEHEIDRQLLSADIILLLISPDFIASDYCWGREMQQAMERHAKGDATVIPIMLRAVDWQNAPFTTLQALPQNAKPITQWGDRDRAYADICRSIRAMATKHLG